MLKRNQASLWYRCWHQYVTMMMFKWFSKVEVVGKENIPLDKKYIMIPNHQNAAIDSIVLATLVPQPVLFFVRSDMFKNPLANKFLRSLKMIPAYRQKENFQDVKKNEENIQLSVDILQHGETICMMPEGGQDEKHRLRTFVKGPFRIAFSTLKNNPQEDVFMLPIGLEYGHYDKFGYPLLINIGQPISTKKYYYENNQDVPLAINAIRDIAYEEVKKLMFNIQDFNHYQDLYIVSYICQNIEMQKNNLEPTLFNQMKIRQAIVDKLSIIEDVNFWQSISQYNQYFKRNNIDVLLLSMAESESKLKNSLICLLSLPFFLSGVIGNGLIWLILKWLDKISPTGFNATIKYAMYLVLSPLYHIILALVFGLIFHSWWLAIGILLLMPLIAVFCMQVVKNYRVWIYQFFHQQAKKEMLKLRDWVRKYL